MADRLHSWPSNLEQELMMMRLATFLLAALSTTACVGDPPADGEGNGNGNANGSGSGNGGGGGGGAMTATQFVTAIGMKDCDDAFTCQANFPTDEDVTFTEAFGATQSECYTGAAEYFDAAATEAAIAAGRIDFDGAAAQTCIAGFGAPVCASYWDTGASYPAACDGVMVGKVANGATCAVDFECSNDSYCDPDTTKCTPIPAGE